jgi:hypothetical protein
MKNMRKTSTMAIVAALLSAPLLASAADKCPAELSEAKAMLTKATAASKSTTASQPPRQLAGAKAQDIQAPRTGSQDIQAPRTGSQDIQAPRTGSQDIQAPRTGSQDIQAPRTGSQDIQAPRTGSQDIQAPRTGSQDIQAPRTGSQDIQAPRTGSQDIQAPRSDKDQAARVSKARKLIGEADAACKKGDMALSANKANEAKGLLK